MAEYFDGWFRPTAVNPLPPVASKRTLTAAICDALIKRYTRAALESVLPEELRPSGVDGNLAVTSARSRAHHLGAAENAVRGQQPAGRVLVPASTIGDLVAHELREDRTYVSNRGAAFHQAMMDWLDEWKQDTTKS